MIRKVINSYGAFWKLLMRCLYDAVKEENQASIDNNGDVLDMIKGLNNK